ncbi:MAG: glucuronate isomerase [Treponema sp.]|nr:glucuronate isomerase [Treponema sp.]
MKEFMGDDFLLETKTARELFASCKDEPIWDYHCHLSPADIASNKKMANICEAWLGTGCSGDHYKWRQMRSYGIEEKYITGDAAPYDKFLKWAATVENLIGNPLYHWTHLELRRYFGITEPLTVKSAPAIWEKANTMLQDDSLSVAGIFKRFNVYAVGTTDDPADSLEFHSAIAEGRAAIGKTDTKVCPSFRPDRAVNIRHPEFAQYIEKLSAASGVNIKNSDDVLSALEKRLDFFIQKGCRASDHGMGCPPFELASDAEIDRTFTSALEGKKSDDRLAEAYETKILAGLAQMYTKRGIAMQYHMNAMRDNNKKAFRTLGADTGFDSVHDNHLAQKLSCLLNLIEENGGLPKTILYSLNPADYYPIATLMGSFQGGGIKGKIQLGSAWWFCDHIDGMETQLKTLGALGMLPAFVGMLTDSRSFLSYPRHEYFRRILCNLLGGWVERGLYPTDMESLRRIVQDISFANAKSYFS